MNHGHRTTNWSAVPRSAAQCPPFVPSCLRTPVLLVSSLPGITSALWNNLSSNESANLHYRILPNSRGDARSFDVHPTPSDLPGLHHCDLYLRRNRYILLLWLLCCISSARVSRGVDQESLIWNRTSRTDRQYNRRPSRKMPSSDHTLHRLTISVRRKVPFRAHPTRVSASHCKHAHALANLARLYIRCHHVILPNCQWHPHLQ